MNLECTAQVSKDQKQIVRLECTSHPQFNKQLVSLFDLFAFCQEFQTGPKIFNKHQIAQIRNEYESKLNELKYEQDAMEVSWRNKMELATADNLRAQSTQAKHYELEIRDLKHKHSLELQQLQHEMKLQESGLEQETELIIHNVSMQTKLDTIIDTLGSQRNKTSAKLGSEGEIHILKVLDFLFKHNDSVKYEYCSGTSKSGDICLHYKKFKGCLDSKNYAESKIVSQAEICKLYRDMDLSTNGYDFGILVTLKDNRFCSTHKAFDILFSPKNKPLILVSNIETCPEFLMLGLKLVYSELGRANSDQETQKQITYYQKVLQQQLKLFQTYTKQIKTFSTHLEKHTKQVVDHLKSMESFMI